MTIVIKKTDSPKMIEEKLASFYAAREKAASKGFNANKYLGKLKRLYGDALKYQKQVRDE